MPQGRSSACELVLARMFCILSVRLLITTHLLPKFVTRTCRHLSDTKVPASTPCKRCNAEGKKKKHCDTYKKQWHTFHIKKHCCWLLIVLMFFTKQRGNRPKTEFPSCETALPKGTMLVKSSHFKAKRLQSI